MHVNHQYLLWMAGRLWPGGAVLDYGCGGAETVDGGRRRGVNVWGADVFDDEKHFATVRAKMLHGDAVRTISDGRAPFPDEHFHVVISNNVFEYVEELHALLIDVRRLLKPGGYYLSLFPTLDVWRDGRQGIPFLHRLPSGSSFRLLYTQTMLRLGFGGAAGRTDAEAAQRLITHLDEKLHYRTHATVVGAIRDHFEEVRSVEPEYIRFRLQAEGRRWATKLLDLSTTRAVATYAFRHLVGSHILATKGSLPQHGRATA